MLSCPKTTDLDCQRQYWDTVAPTKTFTNEIAWPQWRQYVQPDAEILDVGCGYGRTCAQLADAGFSHLVGVDISSQMIERGKREHPELDLRFWNADALPFPNGSFDAVCLIAVLTCIPSDAGQKRLRNEIIRVLKPGGILFLSDFPVQNDDRNRARYDLFAEKYGTYGVFELPEGTVLRHHALTWFDELLEPMTTVERLTFPWKTMNGNNVFLEQRFARKNKKE